ncbi:MAG: type II toxin-antitoxin system Phd/YefM family antitoxin [Thermoleophilaceae bacterium]|nr:type II toxin-antitoxin system Phd/YefM family antitoxin [Thermoleophilaceae bacterium]MBA3840300.1 type II toxin-antitoxin system Phd/YefM family antitoxin [Thermoleophilaceae bacterium]
MSTEQEVNVSTFKAKCLGLLDEVAETGRPLIVTKRGRPVARVVAVEDPPSLRNSVRFLVSDDEIVEPIDAAWNATRR